MRKGFGVIAVVLSLVMVVAGCSSKDQKEPKGDSSLKEGVSIGGYVEENIVLPEGIDPKEFVSITASPDGGIEVYAYNNNAYEKYLYQDRKWRKADAEALQIFNDPSASHFVLKKVFYGEDMKQYLLGDTPSGYQNVLYRLSDTGVYEKVELKRFEEKNKEWNDLYCRPKVIKVLENGMIAAAYPWSIIEVYAPDGKSMLAEYQCGMSCVMAAEGNTLYYADQNDKQLLSINMETKEEGSPRAIDLDVYATEIVELVNGNAYLCNTSGLHLNVEGASLWETLLDGNQSSLGMPTERLTDFVIGKEDEYYIVLSSMYNSDFSVKHIFYDEAVSSVPPEELTIFSIDDNPTIRQAIAVFQENHPDIRINFRTANTDNNIKCTYGVKNPKQTVTLKDQLNALNTELLAGKGPDIFVLDGMPIEAFIEKGVLEDMGSIFSSMKDSGELLPNITEPYKKDGKVYAMPIRFRFPIIYGARDAVNAADSITELAEYAKNHKEIPMLPASNYRALAAWLFFTYYDQISDPAYEIDEAVLQEFLETIHIISEAIHASDDAQLIPVGSSNGAVIMITLGYWTGGSVELYQGNCQSNMEEMGGMMDFALPLKVLQKREGNYGAINQRFKAYGLMGINSAGKQKELAKEFIQLLFSKDIQGLDLQDGFPVNKAAMEEWTLNDKVNYFSIPLGEDTITADYPEKATRDNIYQYIRTLDKPMVNDMTMMDMILDEAERYLREDITAEQAAGNAVASINLYLSE